MEENKDNQNFPNKKGGCNKLNKPMGVLILGTLCLFIFGLLPLSILLFVYSKPSSEFALGLKTMIEDAMNKLQTQGEYLQVSDKQFKTILMAQMIITVPFILAGAGVLFRKEWARRLILIFSFTISLIIFVSVAIRQSNISEALMQIVFPGSLIIYFTNKNVTQYFTQQKKEIIKNTPGE